MYWVYLISKKYTHFCFLLFRVGSTTNHKLRKANRLKRELPLRSLSWLYIVKIAQKTQQHLLKMASLLRDRPFWHFGDQKLVTGTEISLSNIVRSCLLIERLRLYMHTYTYLSIHIAYKLIRYEHTYIIHICMVLDYDTHI